MAVHLGLVLWVGSAEGGDDVAEPVDQVRVLLSAHAAYGSFLDRSELSLSRCTLDTSRVREAYGDHTYRRLAEVKAKYDPDNTFHHNKNIRPGREPGDVGGSA